MLDVTQRFIVDCHVICRNVLETEQNNKFFEVYSPVFEFALYLQIILITKPGRNFRKHFVFELLLLRPDSARKQQLQSVLIPPGYVI